VWCDKEDMPPHSPIDVLRIGYIDQLNKLPKSPIRRESFMVPEDALDGTTLLEI
jgi:hypothetical protein